MLSRAAAISHRGCAFSCSSGILIRSNGINCCSTFVGEDLIDYGKHKTRSTRQVSSFLGRGKSPLGNYDSCVSVLSSEADDTSRQRYQLQQVRYMGRRDGYSKFNKERKPTKKQRKAYNRRMANERSEREKHGAPGSKANAIKDWVEDHFEVFKKEAKGELPAMENDPEFNQYTRGHAMIEDLMGNTAHLTSTETPRISDESRRYEKQFKLVKHLIDSGQEPSDEALSLLVRSFRDKFGGQRFYSPYKETASKKKAVGVARALQLLTRNLDIPASQLKEKTLSAVMTCASRSAEARKVLDKMIQRDMPLEYAYSILIDLHAKRGEFVEARAAMDEMSSKHGIQPSVVAYTSLIAACHRAASPPGTPHFIKEQAQEEAWNAWKEMRVIGVQADAMAYGAIIRFYAMRGQAEKCLDFISEMKTFEVRPTSLIFTAALHGIAQSHRNSLRFDGGKSRKGYRAQWIAAHHGKMTRQILIQAEQAEVEQDDGFVSALLLCAGVAGDSATAKAILLASEIRRKDWLRPIGSKKYLEKFLQPHGQNPAIDKSLIESNSHQQQISIDGSELKESLETGTSNALATTDTEDDEENQLSSIFLQDDPRMRKMMLEEDPQLTTILEHNNPFPLENPFVANRHNDQKSGRIPPQVRNEPQKLRSLLEACAQSMQPKGLGDLWGGPKNKGYLCEQTLKEITTRQVPRYVDNSIPGISGMELGLASTHWEEDVDKMSKRLRRSKWMGMDQDLHKYGSNLDDIDPHLASMYDDVREKREALLHGTDGQSLDDDNDEESTNSDSKFFSSDGVYFEDETKDSGLDTEISNTFESSNEFEASYIESSEDNNSDDNQSDNDRETEVLSEVDLSEEQAYGATTDDEFGEENDNNDAQVWTSNRNQALVRTQNDLVREHQEKYELDEFALAMPPGLPAHRIEKLRKAFNSNLGYPSMLELVPLLRENMPDRPRLAWLQKKNLQNAHFVMKRMDDLKMLNNVRSLNSVLSVTASTNYLGKAISFHQVEFERRGLTPDNRSDRMIVEMLLKNKRMSRALKFKDETERAGRTLDLHSYGSFVEYYGNHSELGSALIMLKECIAVHGFPPNEKALKNVRMLCRKKGLLEQTQLEQMIGPDPFQYIREGLMKKRSQKYKRNHIISKIHNMIL